MVDTILGGQSLTTMRLRNIWGDYKSCLEPFSSAEALDQVKAAMSFAMRQSKRTYLSRKPAEYLSIRTVLRSWSNERLYIPEPAHCFYMSV